MTFIKNLLKKLFISLGVYLQKFEYEIAKKSLPKFANKPKNLFIALPYTVTGNERIFIGNNVSLGERSVLRAKYQYPTNSWIENSDYACEKKEFNSKISIGNNVTATANLQIVAMDEIVIEDEVMFATNVFICDGMHGFGNTDIPYKYQPMGKISPIKIKKGCWIGQNVVILPGVTVGEMTIIGANSVVTKSIPDRCIAAGSPARVIKKWDDPTNSWKSVES